MFYAGGMALRLVSHRACPYVQRAVIVLLEKDVPHETQYVDLANKPPWFLELSPRGKVPLLVVDGGAVLFESAAICEFLEETNAPPLMPADPVQRARDRAWGAFSAELLFTPMYLLSTTDKPDELARLLDGVRTTLTRLDAELAGRQWLSGDGSRFGMADAFTAPFFVRAAIVGDAARSPIPDGLDNVRAYGERILARDSVTRSTPDGLAADTVKLMRAKNAAILQ